MWTHIYTLNCTPNSHALKCIYLHTRKHMYTYLCAYTGIQARVHTPIHIHTPPTHHTVPTTTPAQMHSVTDTHLHTHTHSLPPPHAYTTINARADVQMYEHAHHVQPIPTPTKIYLMQTCIQLPIHTHITHTPMLRHVDASFPHVALTQLTPRYKYKHTSTHPYPSTHPQCTHLYPLTYTHTQIYT